MRRIATLLSALAFAALLHAAPPASAAPPCTYTLGFATLHDLAPDVVGGCLSDAAPQPNGDVQQATERGLLVWRKADNWTAFTDGSTTWINGPYGVQARANGERFAWELPGHLDDTGDYPVWTVPETAYPLQ